MSKRKNNDVDIARGRLTGVLQDLIGPSDEESDQDPEPSPHIPARGRPRLKKDPDPPLNTSYEKKVVGSYVLKLFDRSLDLSKYDDHTALYPICRAWMMNAPRSSKLKSFRDRTKPITRARDDTPDLVQKLQNGEIQEIRAMPAVEDIKMANAYPDNPAKEIVDFELKFPDRSKEELLAEHKMKWKRVSSDWKGHVNAYRATKYHNSKELIDAMFSV